MTDANDRGYICLMNGPNLNLLGKRQPEIYGYDTIEDAIKLAADAAAPFGLDIVDFQSNHEGAHVDFIHEHRVSAVGFIINPGAFTHTSVAIRDAFATIEGRPLMEVHISNVHAREAFRHHSYISGIATGIFIGNGIQGYKFAAERIGTLNAAKSA